MMMDNTTDKDLLEKNRQRVDSILKDFSNVPKYQSTMDFNKLFRVFLYDTKLELLEQNAYKQNSEKSKSFDFERDKELMYTFILDNFMKTNYQVENVFLKNILKIEKKIKRKILHFSNQIIDNEDFSMSEKICMLFIPYYKENKKNDKNKDLKKFVEKFEKDFETDIKDETNNDEDISKKYEAEWKLNNISNNNRKPFFKVIKKVRTKYQEERNFNNINEILRKDFLYSRVVGATLGNFLYIILGFKQNLSVLSEIKGDKEFIDLYAVLEKDIFWETYGDGSTEKIGTIYSNMEGENCIENIKSFSEDFWIIIDQLRQQRNLCAHTGNIFLNNSFNWNKDITWNIGNVLLKLNEKDFKDIESQNFLLKNFANDSTISEEYKNSDDFASWFVLQNGYMIKNIRNNFFSVIFSNNSKNDSIAIVSFFKNLNKEKSNDLITYYFAQKNENNEIIDTKWSEDARVNLDREKSQIINFGSSLLWKIVTLSFFISKISFSNLVFEIAEILKNASLAAFDRTSPMIGFKLNNTKVLKNLKIYMQSFWIRTMKLLFANENLFVALLKYCRLVYLLQKADYERLQMENEDVILEQEIYNLDKKEKQMKKFQKYFSKIFKIS